MSRFSIRGLMIAIAAVAGVLALPVGWRELAGCLLASVAALIASRRMLAEGRGRLAGTCFWTLAIAANALYAALSIVPKGLLPELLCVAWLFLLLPALAGFGYAWALLPRRDVAKAGRGGAWVWVITLTVMPPLTAVTVWPFRLVVLAAWPALDRLADRVAAGQPVASPVQVGPFRILGSAVDPASGNVALMVDPNPNGPTAFIRAGTGPNSLSFGCVRPVRGDVLHVRLGPGWCYHEED